MNTTTNNTLNNISNQLSSGAADDSKP
eukprot:SAG22_NODE_18442_length_287_cov_0.824468_2_plen_26_part_01